MAERAWGAEERWPLRLLSRLTSRLPMETQPNWPRPRPRADRLGSATISRATITWRGASSASDRRTRLPLRSSPMSDQASISATMHQDPLHVLLKGPSARQSIRSRRPSPISPLTSRPASAALQHHTFSRSSSTLRPPRNHSTPASCLYCAPASALPAQRKKPRRLVALAHSTS